jgi:hypothetical protein
MVLVEFRRGRLDYMSSGRRKPIKAKGDHQARVQDKVVLIVVSGDDGLREQWPKTLKGKLMSGFRQPRGQLNRQTGSPTERDSLIFFQGIMKR